MKRAIIAPPLATWLKNSVFSGLGRTIPGNGNKLWPH